MNAPEEFDEVGEWTEVKLRILDEYAQKYSQILSNQPKLRHCYIDGFAGSGRHRAKRTGAMIEGSPIIALNMDPPFHHYHFIDLRGNRAQQLRELASNRRRDRVRG